jgi:phosphoribosylaminoimidazole-succinocarboxamide synthase
MGCLERFWTPQLEKVHSGKVRESFRVDERTRLLVATDRLSAFDRVLKTPIAHKGAVLNGLSNFWFERTKGIVANHVVKPVAAQATLVREAVPIRLEMVVRGYLTGSMWRAYSQGRRTFCGATVPDGLVRNVRFAAPLLTPTTKGEKDEEIAPGEAVSSGVVSRELYEEMEQASLKLFAEGTQRLASRGLLLVDTKYEFGLVDGKLALIDELHTPDSSRFWSADEYERDPGSVEALDKEFVRGWMLRATEGGRPMPDVLPDDVAAETSRRYLDLYGRVCGVPLPVEGGEDAAARLVRELAAAGLMKDGFVTIVMGSTADLEHCKRIRAAVERYEVACELRVCSAHKTPEDLAALAREYAGSAEPGAMIAVAGLSNGLGGALAAGVPLPVFSCPPFEDRLDMFLNVNSSLLLPSRIPAATVIRPDSAALAALRALNLPRLKVRFGQEIAETREQLRAADRELRGR